MDRAKLQATYQQLKSNLYTSQTHFQALKKSVQALSNSIIDQVKQIAKLQRQKIGLRQEIGNLDCQLKSIYQQNIRFDYKIQKMQLKIQESQKKKAIYSQMIKKTQQASQLLKQRFIKVQNQTLHEKAQSDKMEGQIIQDQLRSKLQFQETICLQNRVIQNKCQSLKHQITQMQKIQDKIWSLKRKNRSTNDDVKKYQKQIDELNCKTSRKIKEGQQNKQNNGSLNQLQHLSSRNRKLDEKILNYVEWINDSEDILSKISQIDNLYAIKNCKQSLDLLRQVKRNKQHISMIAKSTVKASNLNDF